MPYRAYRYRFYPTPEQVVNLNQTFGCVRYIYNRALRYRQDAWYERQESISYPQSSALLTEWKKEPEHVWLNDVSSVPLQQSLRHLQTAYRNFFQGRAKYPNFKRPLGTGERWLPLTAGTRPVSAVPVADTRWISWTCR